MEETVKESMRDQIVASNLQTETSSTTPKRQTRASGPSDPKTPGTSTRDSITDDSKCDYIIYTVRDADSHVVAVLIEAKTTMHINFKHCVAQVISLVLSLSLFLLL